MPKALLISFLSGIIFITACSKHDSGCPTTPPLLDTLGAGWQAITIDTNNLGLSDVFFVNNQTGFVCGERYLGKSTDGGLGWQRILPDSLNESFINLFFVDANNGWVTGPQFLLRTTDGGKTWQKQYKGSVFDVQFFDANNGFVTRGTPGTGFYRTSDGGATIQQVDNAESIGLFFFNQNSGWFSGAYLYKTTDAAITFTPGSFGFNTSSQYPYAMQFTDTLHGWVTGSGGLFRTINGGASFETLLPGTNGGGDIHFFDNNNGYILANNKIYSTADGGKTLAPMCSIHKVQPLVELHFTDINHGWATGGGNIVYKYVKQ